MASQPAHEVLFLYFFKRSCCQPDKEYLERLPRRTIVGSLNRGHDICFQNQVLCCELVMNAGEHPGPGGRRHDSTSSQLSGPPLELQTTRSSMRSVVSSKGLGNQNPRLAGLARHTLGLMLLLVVVFLWTGSNFMGSVSIACSFLSIRDSNGFRVSLRTIHMQNRSS